MTRICIHDVELILGLKAERDALLAKAAALAAESRECKREAAQLSMAAIARKFEVDRGTIHSIFNGTRRVRGGAHEKNT